MVGQRRVPGWMFVLAIACGLWVSACSEEEPNPAPEDETFVIPDGKADNFFSLSAQEYIVSGEYYVELSAGEADQSADAVTARVRELIYFKQIAVNWFLLQYLMDPTDEHKNKYESLTKNGSYEDLDIKQDPANPLRYTFTFRQEVGGQNDLLAALPTVLGDDGAHHMPLPVGKVSNSDLAKLEINNEWYRKAPWSAFDPTKLSASQLETINLTITPEPRSADAWIDTARLFEGDEVTIGIHWGWDYHKEYHLVHSRTIYDTLVSEGFKSPVAKYDDYTRTSGPLTKVIKANGRDVTVKISLFWGKKGTDTDPDTAAGGIQLEEDMRQSFKERDVIIFSGHSGPFYGYALANWRVTDEGDLDDSELPGLEMPSKYQVVLSEGCDTYAMGEGFWANPAKAGQDNLDVVTTTNFSNASTAGVVKYFLHAIYQTDANNLHQPSKYSDLLTSLDNNSMWFHSMYGVHGIDDNPKVHPYANLAALCSKCGSDSECGGVGNKCIKLVNGNRVCAVECTATEGCPTGYTCEQVATGSWITSKQCVPVDPTCKPPVVSGPALLINELLADPAADATGDANGDGVRDGRSDEFVELLNISDASVDLSGYSLSDSSSTRFVFPANSVVAAGQSVVVFGGGTPNAAKFEPLKATVFVANGLALNNTGDTVTLSNNSGVIVDQVIYGGEGGHDRSLVRATDGLSGAAMIAHPGLACSPGANQSGAGF